MHVLTAVAKEKDGVNKMNKQKWLIIIVITLILISASLLGGIMIIKSEKDAAIISLATERRTSKRLATVLEEKLIDLIKCEEKLHYSDW